MNEPNGIKASFQETSATNNPLGELVNGLMSMSMTLLPNELSTGVYNLEDAAEANEIKVYTDMRTPQGRKKVKILHLENDVLKRMLSVCEIEF